MKEPPKFKVGDEVKITKPKDTSEFPHWISDMDKYDGIIGTIIRIDDTVNMKETTNRGFSPKRLTLVNQKEEPIPLEPTKDYKDTYVRVCSEEEKQKALEFYKDKGKINYGYRLTDNRCYVGWLEGNNEYCLLSSDYLKGTIDITEEVPGKKEEKPTMPKFIPVELKPENYLGNASGDSIFVSDPSTRVPQPFNNLPTTKMSTLRSNIFDRFFKKEESKLADLIEEVEEGFEPVVELYNWLDYITNKQEDLVSDLDRAVELKDKSAIKEAKKKLEEFKKETLEDKLFEQLITISKKLVK